MIIVLDFGGQYNQLIARRVRECNVYAEVHPCTLGLDEIKKMNPKGIIFTGGPNSVYDGSSPLYDSAVFDADIPILGICYGSQMMAHLLGGRVETAPVSEYGYTETIVDTSSVLFSDVDENTVTWMSHTDYIAQVPDLGSVRIQMYVLQLQWSVLKRNFTQPSFIRKLCIPRKGRKCSEISYTMCADAREHGRWDLS